MDSINPDYYKGYAIQPIDFIMKNNLGFCEGNDTEMLLNIFHAGIKKEEQKI